MSYFSLCCFHNSLFDFGLHSFIMMCLVVDLFDISLCTALHITCICRLLDSQEYVRACESLLWTSRHSLAFLFKVLVYPLICPNCYPSPQAAVVVDNCLWLFWQMIPGKRLFLMGNVWVISNKDRLASGVFQRTSS